MVVFLWLLVTQSITLSSDSNYQPLGFKPALLENYSLRLHLDSVHIDYFRVRFHFFVSINATYQINSSL